MSISIDVGLIFGYASQIITWLMPVIGLSAGFGLGFKLISKITHLFSSAI